MVSRIRPMHKAETFIMSAAVRLLLDSLLDALLVSPRHILDGLDGAGRLQEKRP